MGNNIFEDIVYSVMRKAEPTYVDIIVNTVLFVDESKGVELSEEEKKIIEAKKNFYEIFNPIHNSYSKETKSEIAYVTQEFFELVTGPRKDCAVEDINYFYRTYLNNFIFDKDPEGLLSRLHAAVKLHLGYSVGYLKSVTSDENMGVYSPARK